MKRFPNDCDCNCPYYSEYDLSIDDLVGCCDLLKKQCDLCDGDFSLYICPKSEDKEYKNEINNDKDFIDFDKSLEEINKIINTLNIKELADKYRKIAEEMGCSTEEVIRANNFKQYLNKFSEVKEVNIGDKIEFKLK